jgi:hypothetical protein
LLIQNLCTNQAGIYSPEGVLIQQLQLGAQQQAQAQPQ